MIVCIILLLHGLYLHRTKESCAGILEQSMGARIRVGKEGVIGPALQTIHRLAESIPWN